MAEEQQRRGAYRTSIGGQALIEGILMRGPEKQAIVVRDKDGKLVEKVEELRFIKDRYPILGEGPDVFRRFLPGRGGRAALQI